MEGVGRRDELGNGAVKENVVAEGMLSISFGRWW